LNGTAISICRAIIAIIENNQTKDGEILIPEVLQKWMGKSIISKNNGKIFFQNLVLIHIIWFHWN